MSTIAPSFEAPFFEFYLKGKPGFSIWSGYGELPDGREPVAPVCGVATERWVQDGAGVPEEAGDAGQPEGKLSFADAGGKV